MTEFRSRANGSHYPLTPPSGRVPTSEGMTVHTAKPIGIMARRAIRKGEGQKDYLPNVSHQTDFGWKSFMEGLLYKDLDRNSKAKVRGLIKRAQGSDRADAAVALTELEHLYPDAYEHAFGKTADIPRHT